MIRQKVSGRNGKELRLLDARRVREIIRRGNGNLVELLENLDGRVPGGLQPAVIDGAKRALDGYLEADLDKRLREGNLGLIVYHAIQAYESREGIAQERAENEEYKRKKFRPIVDALRGGKVRVLHLPTQKVVRNYVTITESDILVPEQNWVKIYESGLEQAFLGVRARVKGVSNEQMVGDVARTHIKSADERMSSYNRRSEYIVDPKDIIGGDEIRKLADFAERGRIAGRLTEFELTYSEGPKRGLKLYVYTSPNFPIVTLSAKPLIIGQLRTNMELYDSINTEAATKKPYGRNSMLVGASKN